MMQYCGYFGVEKIVGSLADFLQFVDTEFEFSSFSDLLPVCVKDILTGLNNNIAHRDLKPSNILVCNQHLNCIAHDETAMGKAYEQCSIVCRLTDFGLSRGVDMQTKSVAMSKTTSINCGILQHTWLQKCSSINCNHNHVARLIFESVFYRFLSPCFTDFRVESSPVRVLQIQSSPCFTTCLYAWFDLLLRKCEL